MSRSLKTKRVSLLATSLGLLALLLSALGVLPATTAQRPATEAQRKVGPSVPLPPAASCNLLQNGDFSNGINVVGNGNFPPSTVPNWSSAFLTPQISSGPGCGGNTGYIRMWGNKGVGEGIAQTNVPIQAGHTYKLSACVKWSNNNSTLPPYVRFNVRASNGPLGSYTNNANAAQIGIIGVPSNTPSIPAPGITSTQWTFVTLANWTAPANSSYNTITINPENNNTANNGNTVSWGDIDNICLQDIRKPCPALDPDFSLTATLGSGNASSFQVTANVATALPANAGFAWIVEEIDLVTGNVIGTPMVNPSAWWSTPMTNVFSGYTFVTGHKYRITRGVWGPCNDWTPISKTVFLCNNCRSAEIKKVPSTQLKPALNEK